MFGVKSGCFDKIPNGVYSIYAYFQHNSCQILFARLLETLSDLSIVAAQFIWHWVKEGRGRGLGIRKDVAKIYAGEVHYLVASVG